jgi:hypothetical protein
MTNHGQVGMSAKRGESCPRRETHHKFFAFDRYCGKMGGSSIKVHEIKMSREFMLVNICLMLFHIHNWLKREIPSNTSKVSDPKV